MLGRGPVPAPAADRTADVVSQLCPAFSEPEYVTSFHPASIQQMLEADVQPQIPVASPYFVHYDSLYPGLFRCSDSEAALRLLEAAGVGLRAQVPSDRAIGMYHTVFWQTVGFGLADIICPLLSVPLTSSRSVAGVF